MSTVGTHRPVVSRARRVSVVALLAATALTSGVTVAAREIWELDWVEARTENFVFVSTISEKRTLALARRLENFRALIVSSTSPQRADALVPFEVYLFDRSVPEIGLTPDIGGYFLRTMASNVIVLRQNWNLEEQIQHEYVHFLLRNRGTRNYPPWLDEGTAELLSTVQSDGASYSIGKPPRVAITRLTHSRWLDFSRILALRDPRDLHGVERAMFYNQSWLLLHYLNWGRRDRAYSQDTSEYLRRIDAGDAPDLAFSESFDLEIASLPRTLRAYGSRLSYSVRALDAPLEQAEISLRPMSPHEVAAGVAQISRGRGDLVSARRYFDSALNLYREMGGQSGLAEPR